MNAVKQNCGSGARSDGFTGLYAHSGARSDGFTQPVRPHPQVRIAVFSGASGQNLDIAHGIVPLRGSLDSLPVFLTSIHLFCFPRLLLKLMVYSNEAATSAIPSNV